MTIRISQSKLFVSLYITFYLPVDYNSPFYISKCALNPHNVTMSTNWYFSSYNFNYISHNCELISHSVTISYFKLALYEYGKKLMCIWPCLARLHPQYYLNISKSFVPIIGFYSKLSKNPSYAIKGVKRLGNEITTHIQHHVLIIRLWDLKYRSLNNKESFFK